MYGYGTSPDRKNLVSPGGEQRFFASNNQVGHVIDKNGIRFEKSTNDETNSAFVSCEDGCAITCNGKQKNTFKIYYFT